MENQLSRYGAISRVLPLMNPGAKVHFVGPSSAAWFGDFQNQFPADKNGGNRVFSTITSALADANVVAGRGDVILVLPGYTQTISAAAGIAVTKSGLKFIGIGEGDLRPTITFATATTADLDIDAADITFKNFIFDCTGVDAVVAAIDVNAIGFTLEECDVIHATASAQATLALLTDANASGLRLIKNRFLGSANAGTAAAVRIVGGNDHEIRGNTFIGDYTTSLGAIDNATTACLNVLVEGNYIYNRTASSTKAMVFQSGSTGIIADNRMQILSGTAPITGAAMSWVGANYYAATIATAGTLI